MKEDKNPKPVKRGRGRPKKVQPAGDNAQVPKRPRGRPKGTNKPIIDNNSIEVLKPEIIDDDQEDKGTNIKSVLTEKELLFLQIYLSGGITQVNALKSAGYQGYNEKYLELLARKIIGKYESQGGDHRKIFREIGAGEMRVAQGILDLAMNAKSEMVRLNAWLGIAKCLGLQKDY